TVGLLALPVVGHHGAHALVIRLLPPWLSQIMSTDQVVHRELVPRGQRQCALSAFLLRRNESFSMSLLQPLHPDVLPPHEMHRFLLHMVGSTALRACAEYEDAKPPNR